MTTTLRFIDGPTVHELAPLDELIGWMREAMRMASGNDVEMPLRRALVLPDGLGMVGMMPGYVGGATASAGVKLVSLVPPERRKGSSHLGLMVLYDADGLVPTAVLCASTITAIRTAAVSAVATDVLARKDSSALTILGAGEQARSHAVAMMQVREFTTLTVWSRNPQTARQFAGQMRNDHDLDFDVAASVGEAVHAADVVCTVTGASEPFLHGASIAPGTHVNLVGSSHRRAAEVDSALVARSEFFVDYRPSTMDQAGELLAAIDAGIVGPDHIRAEIGEVLNGDAEGRSGDSAVTVYKSVGVAAQDIVTAHRVVERAAAKNLGTVVSL